MANRMIQTPEQQLREVIVRLWNEKHAGALQRMVNEDELAALLTLAEATLDAGSGAKSPDLVRTLLLTNIEHAAEKLT